MSNDAIFFLPKLSSHAITVVLSLALSLLPVATVNAQDIITGAFEEIVSDSLTGEPVIEKRLLASIANTETIKFDPEAKQARPSPARLAQEQNAAQLQPARVAPGRKQKIIGVILSREADKMTVRDINGSDVVVTVTGVTKITELKANPFRGAKNYPLTALVRGLKVEIEGRGDSSGVLVAEKIKFTDIDFGIARSRERPPPNDLSPPTIVITSPMMQRGIGVKQSASKITITGQAQDESGIREVTVGDERAQVDDRGNFFAEVFLKVGDNPVTVTATDNHGNRATESFTIRRESEPPSVTGRYFALLIGNNHYPNLLPESQLKTAINDAQEVAKLLEVDYGFKIKLLTDAKRSEIIKALYEYRNSLNPDDNLLIYYAGHGYFDRGAEKAYWMPTDAEMGNNANWIIADDVTTNVRAIPARHILIVSDSCFSGGLTREPAGRLRDREERERYLKKMRSGVARILMASGGNEPVVDGGGKGHSVFAQALLDGLRGMEARVFTADELFHEYIKERVAGKSDQTPEYKTVRNSGHESGDFVFVRKRL